MDAREVIARALCAEVGGSNWRSYRFEADAALSAYLAHLEASGMAIVPVEADHKTKMAGAKAITKEHMSAMANYDAACDCWDAMIAATKDQTDGR